MIAFEEGMSARRRSLHRVTDVKLGAQVYRRLGFKTQR